jgi:AraC-like DNA-binding protein
MLGMSIVLPNVSVRTLYAFAAVLHDEGIPVDPILARAGIPRATYDDPNARVPYTATHRFYAAAAQRSAHPALGLVAARRCDEAQLQLLEYVLASSVNVSAALDLLGKSAPLFSDAPTLWAEARRNTVFLRFQPFGSTGPRCLVEYVVGTLFFLGRRIVGGVAHVPNAATPWFAYPQPADAEEYRTFFDGPIRFDAPANGLLISPRVLGVRMARANASLHELLEPHLTSVVRKVAGRSSLAERVRWLIVDALPTGRSAMTDIAATLRMSRSTLRRRLAREGTSHRALSQEVRASLASHYLEGGATSVTEVAYLVGYDDVTAFDKAFKQWTGFTPTEHRARFFANQRQRS